MKSLLIKRFFFSGFFLLTGSSWLNADPVVQPPGTFIVKDGAAPWSDRVNSWQITDVPADLAGNGPLPQAVCGSRALDLPDGTKAVIFAVSPKDLPLLKTNCPTAQDTGESLTVVHPDGTGIMSWPILKLASPPAEIGGTGFNAGIVLLQLNDKGSGGTAAPITTSAPGNNVAQNPAPSATPAPVKFVPPQNPFDCGDPTQLHIFLLMGQSNMVGRDTTGLELQTTDPRIGYFDGKNWIIAIEPMKGGSGFGPGTFFAKEMLPQYPNGKIGLVPCAVGGTPLKRWVKGADLYEQALKRAKLAAQSGKIEGILWHQGESDSNTVEDASTYEARLTQMFKDFRQDLGQPDLPIVVGELGDFYKAAQAPVVKAAIKNMPNDLPHVGFADSAGLTHKGDHLHFNAASQKEFGSRYAEAMKQLQSGKVSP